MCNRCMLNKQVLSIIGCCCIDGTPLIEQQGFLGEYTPENLVQAIMRTRGFYLLAAVGSSLTNASSALAVAMG